MQISITTITSNKVTVENCSKVRMLIRGAKSFVDVSIDKYSDSYIFYKKDILSLTFYGTQTLMIDSSDIESIILTNN